MKLGQHLVNLITLIYFHLSNATLIIKFSKVPYDYSSRIIKGQNNDVDILYNIVGRSRLAQGILCAVVMSSRKFIYIPEGEIPLFPTEPSTIDLSTISPIYSMKTLYVGFKRRHVHILKCTNDENSYGQWFIIFGLVDKFMYLVEPSKNSPSKNFVVKSIVEPSALIARSDINQLSNYFWEQVRTSLDWVFRGVIPEEMTTVCHLNPNDHVRLCSSAIERLNMEGYFENAFSHISYIKIGKMVRCRKKTAITVDPNKTTIMVDILPCSINVPIASPQFYVLADPQEHGAIFVFFYSLTDGLLKLRARLRKISALLNPSKYYFEKRPRIRKRS